MKKVNILLLIVMGAFVLPSLAFATDYQRRHINPSPKLGYSDNSGGQSGHRNDHYNNRYYTPRPSYDYRHNSRHRYSYGLYGGGSRYSYGLNYYGAYPRHSYSDNRRYNNDYADKACHKVVKVVTESGYSHRVGGTMCYDRYGESYIVPGSRYNMR